MEIKRIQPPEIPLQPQEAEQNANSTVKTSTDEVIPFHPDFSQEVMPVSGRTQQLSQIKPVLSEMITRLPGSDSDSLSLKENLHGLLQTVNLDSTKSKIEPEKQQALNQFTGAVSKAAANISQGSVIPLGTTIKTLIADVKSIGGTPLPKHVDDGLGNLTNLLDKAQEDKTAEAEAAKAHADDSVWQTLGTTSAVVVGVVAVVAGVFTFGAPSAGLLPAAGFGAATGVTGAAAASFTAGGAAAAGLATSGVAATGAVATGLGAAAAAAAITTLAPALSTAAAGDILNEMQDTVQDLLSSLW